MDQNYNVSHNRIDNSNCFNFNSQIQSAKKPINRSQSLPNSIIINRSLQYKNHQFQQQDIKHSYSNYQNQIQLDCQKSQQKQINQFLSKNFSQSQQSIFSSTVLINQNHQNISPQGSLKLSAQRISNKQSVSKQKYELLTKQFKNILYSIKKHHKNITNKIKKQNEKTAMIYKAIEKWVQTLEISVLNKKEAFQFLQQIRNIRSMSDKPYQQYLNIFSPYQARLPSETVDSETYTQMSENFQSLSNSSSYQLELEQFNQIESLIEQKLKIQHNQNSPKLDAQFPIYQHPVPSKKREISRSRQKKLKSIPNVYFTQKQFQNQQIFYPDQFTGEESFLINEEVQQRQRQKKKLVQHQKANTMGMRFLEEISYHQCKTAKNINKVELEKEYKNIDKFYNNYFCQKVQCASKNDFMKMKISKLEIYKLYCYWRKQNQGSISVLGKRVIQSNINNQFKKRFPNAKDDRDSFVGVMFKDINLHDFIKNSSKY